MSANPLINILIRTSNRPLEFQKCIKSIKQQSYENIQVIVCTDSPDKSIRYIRESINGMNSRLFAVASSGFPYCWNLYCNELKERVADGWFFYLDDDDWISRGESLQAIAPHLDDPNVGVICQYYRGRLAKPVSMVTRPDRTVDSASIIKGRIGGSAIFLHHSQKNIADWQGHKAADYTFIKSVSEKLPLKFIRIPVVQAGNGGRHGL